ncbi:NUDIX domain-containing protein [Burkholderiaceae bacterium DAT-1]|nr:NUDIX domain-containing protein [Burkholderiaceae bacterium DAT-1]
MNYLTHLRTQLPDVPLHALALWIIDTQDRLIATIQPEPDDHVLAELADHFLDAQFVGVLTDLDGEAQQHRTVLVYRTSSMQDDVTVIRDDAEFKAAIHQLNGLLPFTMLGTGLSAQADEYWRQCRKKVGHDLLFVPSAGTMVQDDTGRVLLQRRTDDHTWSILGGCVEIGETPMDAAIRETYEESGLRVKLDRLLSIATGDDGWINYPNGDSLRFWGFLFLATVVSGDIHVSNDESAELRWFTPAELEALAPLNVYARFNRMNAALTDIAITDICMPELKWA